MNQQRSEPQQAEPNVPIVLGMTVNDVSGKAIANLGWKEIKLRLWYSAVTRSMRNPRSWKSGNRSYGPRSRAYSRVMESVRSALISKRGHVVDDKH